MSPYVLVRRSGARLLEAIVRTAGSPTLAFGPMCERQPERGPASSRGCGSSPLR